MTLLDLAQINVDVRSPFLSMYHVVGHVHRVTDLLY